MKKYFPYLLCLIPILLSIPAILPLSHAGWFPMHDDAQVQRVYEMTKSLGDGMFPVRWVKDLGYGYGYPIFNFYAPVAYYIGAFFTFLTHNSLIGTKLMIEFSVLLSALTMHLLGRRLWGAAGGILASVFYVFAPYHALDIYVRGDIAESIAYASIPLVFLGIYEVYKSRSVRGVVIGSIGYALLISSHNLTAFMMTPFILLALITLSITAFRKKEAVKVRLYWLLFLLGLGLSAWYWLPVLLEMHYTNVLSQVGGGADFRDHFVCLNQLWNSPWGYGGSTKGCIDGLSFRIGKLHILGMILAMITAFCIYRRQREKALVVLFLLSITLISVFLLLPQSQFIWENIKPMAFFQYPWRFLLPISFATSLAIGGIVGSIPKHFKLVTLFVTVLGVLSNILFYQKLFIPQQYLSRDSSYFESRQNLSFTTSQISAEYMPPHFKVPKIYKDVPMTPLSVENTDGSVSIHSQNTSEVTALVKLKDSSMLYINTAYFPAWHLTIDGRETYLMQTTTGMSARVPTGIHMVNLMFDQTLIEWIANSISLICVLLILSGIISLRYGGHKKTS